MVYCVLAMIVTHIYGLLPLTFHILFTIDISSSFNFPCWLPFQSIAFVSFFIYLCKDLGCYLSFRGITLHYMSNVFFFFFFKKKSKQSLIFGFGIINWLIPHFFFFKKKKASVLFYKQQICLGLGVVELLILIQLFNYKFSSSIFCGMINSLFVWV